MNEHEIALSIAEDTLAKGGGTFTRQGTQVSPKAGYAVAYANGRTIPVLLDLDNPHTLMHPLAHALSDLNLDHPGAAFIGTWLDQGLLYLDAVVIVDTYDEAVFLAQREHQLAFYNFANNEVVMTPATPEQVAQAQAHIAPAQVGGAQ